MLLAKIKPFERRLEEIRETFSLFFQVRMIAIALRSRCLAYI